MKQIVIFLLSSWMIFTASAQITSLHITTGRTTSLVFPYPIRHVDRGTKDILVQQVQEAENILLVKAAVKYFTATNLSVVLTDGSIYSYALQYDADPSTWIYQVPANKDASLETYAKGIALHPRKVWGIKDESWMIASAITGIYIKDKVIYYQLRLNNHSTIDYDIDFMRFYIRDKRKGKRTATQEIELKPLYVTGNTTQVKANAQNRIVIALEKFTLPDAKFLAIEINEKNGGRNLTMKVKNKKIMRAIELPDVQ